LPVVFCLDRAGLVGDDGPTHHGIFDISFLRTVPNSVIIAPKDGSELRDALAWSSTYNDGPVFIRYPRATVPEDKIDFGIRPFKVGSWEIIREGEDLAVLAVGSMVYNAWKAADILDKDRISCRVINCRFVSPMDCELLEETLNSFDNVVTVCENNVNGGFGEGVLKWAADNGYANNFKILGIPGRFVEHGNRDSLLRNFSLDPEGLAVAMLEMMQKIKIRSGAKKRS
jgi:1-deoxy-D-xylulose-5-phosphate synthase